MKREKLAKLITEAIINEMNANKLNSNISVEKKGDKLLISFGKNGWGLSDEFLKIHKIIYKLSQTHNVYLEKCIVDTLDDVYNFTFSFSKIEDEENV